MTPQPIFVITLQMLQKKLHYKIKYECEETKDALLTINIMFNTWNIRSELAWTYLSIQSTAV